ncbi:MULTISPECIES: hypothetical protein [Paraburkholderia]|uniref:hypothetical protein n=1 Tax=Paraburkholderia TaxID=1822464 RepID=UPI001656577A|nr:hypothetical protein [Paraburkholderia podalyriae]
MGLALTCVAVGNGGFRNSDEHTPAPAENQPEHVLIHSAKRIFFNLPKNTSFHRSGKLKIVNAVRSNNRNQKQELSDGRKAPICADPICKRINVCFSLRN